MTTIHCAYDEEIANNLIDYLNKKGEDSTREKDRVFTKNKIRKKILDKFLDENELDGYSVMLSEPNTFIVAKKTSVEDFGLAQCEICGFVAFDEELFAHRRAHGI